MATDTTTLKPGVTAHSNVHASTDLNATKAPVAVVAAEAPEAVVAAGTLGSACTTQAEHEKASCVTQNEEQPEVMHADLVAKTIDGFQTYCRVEKGLWPLQDKDTAPFVRAGGHRALLHSIMESSPYLSYYEAQAEAQAKAQNHRALLHSIMKSAPYLSYKEVQAEAQAKAQAEFLAAAQQHQEENKALKAEVAGLRIVLEQIKQTTKLYADTFKTQDTSEQVV